MAMSSRHGRRSSRASADTRPSLTTQERWTALTVALAVCVPPWLLGGMRWWQQLIFLGLAILPFVCALVLPGPTTTRERVLRLLRFPVFWISLFFLAYIIIGALNYSWDYVSYPDRGTWKMVRLPAEDYIAWLPQGVRTPFDKMSPWRVVILVGSGLLLACSVWVGMTRRRALHLVIGIVAMNAFLVALLVILQELSDTKLIYWHYTPVNPHFAGPFHYRNHGVAYLYLGLAAAYGAVFLHWRRMREEALTSSPAPLFMFFAFVILMAIFMAGSRGGIVFSALVSGMAALVFLKTVITSGRQGFIALAVVGASLALGFYFAWPMLQRALPELSKRWSQTEKSFDTLKENEGVADQRILLTQATMEMWRDRPWLGWGAGSYRFIFPKYQIRYNYLYYSINSIRFYLKSQGKRPLRHQGIYYAHNDWAQSLAEYGIIGVGLLCLSLGYWAFLALRHLSDFSGEVFMLYSGAGALFLHSLFDFPFWNPPVLFLFVVLLAMAGTQITLPAQRRQSHA